MIRADVAVNFGKTSGFKSAHASGANVIMGDASVRFLSESIDYLAYNILGSRANEDIVPNSSY